MFKENMLLKSLSVFLMIVAIALIVISQKASIKHADPPSDTGTLSDEMNKILTNPRLNGATVGISIRKASDGEVMYAHLGDTRVHPASVMKLLTGAAALETLGLNHTFGTELYTDGLIRNGVLSGNLYLRGQGDPTLMKKDLDAFAINLKAKGINAIDGNVYGDDTWYDDVRLSQDLNWSDELYHTGAQVSALTVSPNNDYDAGTVIIEVSPGAKVNRAASIDMVPANDYMKIVNETRTVEKNGSKSIRVERLHGSNTVIVSGTIPSGATKTRAWTSVWEPTNYALSLFKNAMDEQGIQFVSVPKVGRAKVPNKATLLVAKKSMKLEELFGPFMKLSNNGHAELLVKEMGQVLGGEGSWDEGLEVLERTLADIGLDSKTMLLRDGSGMSHKNLVTTNEVTKLLYKMQEKSWYPVLLNSLPVAGHSDRLVGGTLRNRMKGTVAEGNIRAKTGMLNGVAALSGYVETKDNELLTFSIIINNHLDDKISEVIDEIVVVLANYTGEGQK